MKRSSLINYFLLVTILSIVMLLIYATVQQSYRTAADDPQIQMAQDASAKIEQGKPADNIFQTDTIDIAHSLSPFIVLYDAAGTPLESTGYLNGKMPKLPPGVFDFAKKNGGHNVTWQPQNDVRMAMVLIHVNSSPVQFVAAGRSLTEVEIRESGLRKMVFLGWIICIAVVLLSIAIGYYKNQKDL